MDRNDISQKIYEMRRKGREEHLKLQGTDIEHLRKVEAGIDGEYVELAEAVRKSLSNMGDETVELHAASRERYARMFQKVTEGVISPDIGELRPHPLWFVFRSISPVSSEMGTIQWFSAHRRVVRAVPV